MKITSLDQNRQFQRLYKKGKSAVTSTMVVYALPNRQNSCRLGITAGKKIGGAVERNRAKRRIRELFRLEQSSLKAFDFCIVARNFTLTAPYHKLVRDFRHAMDTLEATIDETALH